MHDMLTQVRTYETFLDAKTHMADDQGFEPLFVPEWLFTFQRSLVEWAIRKGRAAIFADCGLGKTPMQLVWAENVVRHTNGRVLILTPLAVGPQTVREAEKFAIEAEHSRNGQFKGKIVVTNYEKLHLFDPKDFVGCVCDESSILKNFNGETRKQVTRFMSKMSYRLLCTATAAPNDYIELGTSSEALGELSYSEMLKRFFKYLDDKGQKQEQKQQDRAESILSNGGGEYYQKLAYRVAQTIGQWRLKHHAVIPFWQWVAGWSRACRMPSDLGFSDDQFLLPALIENDHVIKANTPPDGMLFNLPAFGLGAERDERKRTLTERCEYVAALVKHDQPAVIWCQMNAEADLLEQIIPDSQQIAGKTPEDRKLELYNQFTNGELRVLIIKPKIGAWGLNWQHCNHVVAFATHSYEQYYQSIRRCYRFGQTRPVTVDVVATEGEVRVLENMRAKAKRADLMFESMIRELNDSVRIDYANDFIQKEIVPVWL